MVESGADHDCPEHLPDTIVVALLKDWLGGLLMYEFWKLDCATEVARRLNRIVKPDVRSRNNAQSRTRPDAPPKTASPEDA
jgi:hypothetical protein